MKVAIFSTQSYDREFFNAVNADFGHELLYLEPALTANTAVLATGCDAVCVFVNDLVDAATLTVLHESGIRTVVLRCAGFNQVDLITAKNLNISVFRVPSYSPEAVAEHAVAMIMTLNRKTHKAYNRIREGNFSLERLTGFNLYGKKVGLIGLGQIGLAFAKIMHGFGTAVYAYDPVVTAVPSYIQLVDYDQLVTTADIISIHCPLNEMTRHMINQESFDKMKDGVMLINTSRGAILDSNDAIEALKKGKLGYLGIDVYEQEEKLFFRDLSESLIADEQILRLMSFPNVLITAHQGFFTTEALREIAGTTLQNLTDAENGKTNQNQL
ncbi:2-hydroxyacid dehydrogenase [Pedobacter sp. MC2016-15]|uniref:2-hydroxyacid dehydrogenase n=1 Tax=Pedobacter sp. MC2016-15 TaxID=2994473 RepID=UPI0022456996|nr:2-hydroxyacid dehydrogenase [Pedobacter sp. MC2016-15]MCX2479799.1 2-hydroxyacid dehydrogenase [Pedobacter sp. MC2016-15]